MSSEYIELAKFVRKAIADAGYDVNEGTSAVVPDEDGRLGVVAYSSNPPRRWFLYLDDKEKEIKSNHGEIVSGLVRFKEFCEIEIRN
ncbi:MAG: hypothetical protein GW906_02500 [Epsilonproteobacteria bacterium]|nr:hypothetical protein [Campylobacterota bacterium]OIO18050.1 MAG: hypothetical protein AUJ81_00245 [Helicobacteraceae bacterium CG1_02_36_14]PIP11515.1 MAG: hypothetical protein COX50_00250 [Sulfurimonas sp. CG23_combo_of_CG06-09_8_20_14_all_36_33]PIS24594.1 MAG: hypothetical protein COT46_08865 [Sulfurimonas sp. CG08_land_8_20_14_0_20_36_33]PIU33532.1 MAG: hypothetical protein COT05_11715 [Sulfurimonas sp. CG07_land_8_20_14_0_80_36_56]PIV03896.1 MAG: hypothetical protein COS56_06515 [Sulfur